MVFLLALKKKVQGIFMKFVIYTPHYGQDVTRSEVIYFDKDK